MFGFINRMRNFILYPLWLSIRFTMNISNDDAMWIFLGKMGKSANHPSLKRVNFTHNA